MALVTDGEVREQLRIDEGEDADLLPSLVSGALGHIEKEFGIVGMEREETFAFDAFGASLVIPRRPVDPETVSIHYLDTSGAEIELTEFRTFRRGGWTVIAPAGAVRFPATLAGPGSVTVTATIGYPETAPTADPCFDASRSAALVMIAHLFRDREGASPPPPAVALLLDGFYLRGV